MWGQDSPLLRSLPARDDVARPAYCGNLVTRWEFLILERPIETLHPSAIVDIMLLSVPDRIVGQGETFTEEFPDSGAVKGLCDALRRSQRPNT